MCKYCFPLRDIPDGLRVQCEINSESYFDMDDGHCFLEPAHFEIFFCPFCGQKLKDDEL